MRPGERLGKDEDWFLAEAAFRVFIGRVPVADAIARAAETAKEARRRERQALAEALRAALEALPAERPEERAGLERALALLEGR